METAIVSFKEILWTVTRLTWQCTVLKLIVVAWRIDDSPWPCSMIPLCLLFWLLEFGVFVSSCKMKLVSWLKR